MLLRNSQYDCQGVCVGEAVGSDIREIMGSDHTGLCRLFIAALTCAGNELGSH